MATDKDTPDATTAAGKPKADPAPKARTRAAEASEQDTDADGRNVRSPLDPYPDYASMELGELRALAKDKGVGVPADVEKAALVAHLRRNPPEDPDHREATGETEVDGSGTALRSYDLMTVDELRSLVKGGDSALSEDEERGYLVGQLRAVVSGPAAAQSAQVGSNRPAESLPAPSGTDDVSGVRDKDAGRS